MKHFVFTLMATLSFCCQSQSPNTTLFPAIENGLWGYINQSGTPIIDYKFRTAGSFSEGLAPVRLNGTYGYIDSTGQFVIQPQFDVAYAFESGQAKVYIDGKPYFINKRGEKEFEHPYVSIVGLGAQTYAIVKTKNDRYGLINAKGHLMADTVFSHIQPFNDGLAIVKGPNHKPYPHDKDIDPLSEVSFIDTTGKMIVPYGAYNEINEFIDGYALVEFSDNYFHPDTTKGVIDTKGNLQFKIPNRVWSLAYGYKGFSDGLAIIDLYFEKEAKENRYSYKGAINEKGELVFSNILWEEITPFKDNRAFAEDTNGVWHLINRKGEIVSKKPYEKILFSTYRPNPKFLFQNGVQFVKTTEGIIGIDSTGKTITKAPDLNSEIRDLHHRGSLVFIQEDISIESDRYSYRYGFWDTNTGTIIAPQFHQIPIQKFYGDLVMVIEDARLGYIDHSGKYVWREKEIEQQKVVNLNIDFMNRGYFYASSPRVESLAGLGGWGKAENGFQKTKSKSAPKGDSLQVFVNVIEKDHYRKIYNGIKLYVYNQSKDTAYFPAQDSRLYLKIQALDKRGAWRDIEYLPSSWCGNSYHTLFLPTGCHWEFTIPVYEGEFKTKLRAELFFTDKPSYGREEVIFSNEFEGSVNPGQFWKKTRYIPSGLMDPYFD